MLLFICFLILADMEISFLLINYKPTKYLSQVICDIFGNIFILQKFSFTLQRIYMGTDSDPVQI